MDRRNAKYFDALKLKVVTAPVIAYSDYEKAFLIRPDASNKAIGSVISQLDDDGRELPIHYASRGQDQVRITEDVSGEHVRLGLSP